MSSLAISMNRGEDTWRRVVTIHRSPSTNESMETLFNGVHKCILAPSPTTNNSRVLRRCIRSCLLMSILFVSAPTTAAAWHSIGPTTTRRSTLQRLVEFGSASILPGLLDIPSPASAKNLPGPVSVDTSQAGTAGALDPVLQLKKSLERLQTALEGQDSGTSVDSLVKSIPTSEIAFKSIFDAYSDPVSYKQKFVEQNAFLVYYSKGFDGPGRPSIESDLPVKQTLQYGARNDAWVAWEEFLAELEFQHQNPSEADKEDLSKPLSNAITAMSNYLDASGTMR